MKVKWVHVKLFYNNIWTKNNAGKQSGLFLF